MRVGGALAQHQSLLSSACSLLSSESCGGGVLYTRAVVCLVQLLYTSYRVSCAIFYTRATVSAQAALLLDWPEVTCAVFIHELPCLPKRFDC